MIFKIKRYEYDAYISFLYYDKNMKEIICIPGRRKKKNLKVAAYCRVSTKEESQQGSIDSQALYYEQLINENPDWILAGIYVDYGSGLRRNGRDSLELMVEDACNGKIDYIITKSLSRFSRNTVDALEIIRLLKGRRIAMYFENLFYIVIKTVTYNTGINCNAISKCCYPAFLMAHINCSNHIIQNNERNLIEFLVKS